MPLTADDQRHLIAAEGYTALGMYLDANAELEAIDPEVRHVAEVLTVRLEIYRGLEKWELMRNLAGLRHAPGAIHGGGQSYCC